MGPSVDAQDRASRGVNTRNRVPARMIGARGGQLMHNASHINLQPGESIVEQSPVVEEVVGEPIGEEHIIDGEHIMHEHGGCDCEGGCDSCMTGGEFGYCDHCHAPNRFCICFPAHGWVHAEYLLWYQKGMNVPPLITTTTNTNNQAVAGVLNQAGTSVLFGGNNDVLSDERSGGRIRFGWWLERFPGLGIEGEYVGLAQGSEILTRASGTNGLPVLARPFFNTQSDQQDAELVAFPGVVNGTVTAEATTALSGAAFRFRKQISCSSGTGFSEFICQTIPVSSRLDGTMGYRYWELKESIAVREQLTALAPNAGTFDITDRFETRNQFNGAELGFVWQGRRGWWTLDALMRLGIGNVHQTATISGSTARTQNGVALPGFNTGFLAGQTNVGTYDRDQFTMIPELGLTAGYQLTRRWRATVGYSLIYWGNVIRPGDQIDTDVNPSFVQPQLAAPTGAQRPQFQFQQADYWVQGLNFGAEFRW